MANIGEQIVGHMPHMLHEKCAQNAITYLHTNVYIHVYIYMYNVCACVSGGCVKKIHEMVLLNANCQ